MHGEFDSADSIKLDDSLKYQTVGGRTVYGGGGIMPDIFIPRDTSGITSYFSNVVSSGVLYMYALDYSDRGTKEKFSSFKDYQELWTYLKQQPLVNNFANYAVKQGIKKRPNLIAISYKLIETQLAGLISSVISLKIDDGFYPVFLSGDLTIRKAIEVLKSGKAYPISLDTEKSL